MHPKPDNSSMPTINGGLSILEEPNATTPTVDPNKPGSSYPELRKLLFFAPINTEESKSNDENEQSNQDRPYKKPRSTACPCIWHDSCTATCYRVAGKTTGRCYISRIRKIKAIKEQEKVLHAARDMCPPEPLPPRPRNGEEVYELVQQGDGLLKAVALFPQEVPEKAVHAVGRERRGECRPRSDAVKMRERKRDAFTKSLERALSKHLYVLTALSSFSSKRARFPREFWTIGTHKRSVAADTIKSLGFQEQLNILLKYELRTLQAITLKQENSTGQGTQETVKLAPPPIDESLSTESWQIDSNGFAYSTIDDSTLYGSQQSINTHPDLATILAEILDSANIAANTAANSSFAATANTGYNLLGSPLAGSSFTDQPGLESGKPDFVSDSDGYNWDALHGLEKILL